MKPKREGAKSGTASKSPRKGELELAYQIHALAWLVHGRLVAADPWAASPPRSPLVETPLTGATASAWSVPAAWPCCP